MDSTTTTQVQATINSGVQLAVTLIFQDSLLIWPTQLYLAVVPLLTPIVLLVHTVLREPKQWTLPNVSQEPSRRPQVPLTIKIFAAFARQEVSASLDPQRWAIARTEHTAQREPFSRWSILAQLVPGLQPALVKALKQIAPLAQMASFAERVTLVAMTRLSAELPTSYVLEVTLTEKYVSTVNSQPMESTALHVAPITSVRSQAPKNPAHQDMSRQQGLM